MNKTQILFNRLLSVMLLAAVLLSAAGFALVQVESVNAQTQLVTNQPKPNGANTYLVDAVTTYNNYAITINYPMNFQAAGENKIVSSTILNNANQNPATWIGANRAILVAGEAGTSLTVDNVTVNNGTSGNLFNVYDNNTLNLNRSTINMKSAQSNQLIWVISNAKGVGTANISNTNFTADSNAPRSVLFQIGGHPSDGPRAGGNVNLSGTNNFTNINGAIYNNGTLTVKDGTTTFTNSTVELQKGGIIVEGGTLEFNGTVVQVSDQIDAGVTLFTVKNGATLKFTNGSEFNLTGLNGKTNSTVVNVEPGGKLVVDGANTSIVGTSWNSNTGMIIIEKGTLEITNGAEISGFTNLNQSAGNVILVKNGSTLTITNASVTDNIAHNNVGTDLNALPEGVIGIADSKATVSGSVFENNTSQRGGALFIVNGSLTVGDDNSFTGNKSKYSGGAIFGMQQIGKQLSITIGKSDFSGNETYLYGGAICQLGGTLTLGKADDPSVMPVFTNNKATVADRPNKYNSQGGALAVEVYCVNDTTCAEPGSMQVEMYNGTFEGNTAVNHGGAVTVGINRGIPMNYNPAAVTMNIHRGTFVDNKITNNEIDDMAGGAIYIDNDATLTMKRVAITGNTTNTGGGAIASCSLGNNYIYIREGAAIFGNTAGHAEAAPDFQEIYISDKENQYNLFEEKMFNGGLHRWVEYDQVVATRTVKGETKDLVGKFMGSNPTNKDITTITPYVIFTGNTANGTPATGKNFQGNGGAIGNNGILKIGEESTTISIEKIWENVSGTIPNYVEFLHSLVLKADGSVYPLGTITMENTSEDPVYYYSASADPYVLIKLEVASPDSFVITIFGLPKEINGTAVTTWTLEENLPDYTPSISGDQTNGFTLTNTYSGEEPVTTVDIDLTKTWSNEPVDHTRPSNEDFLNALTLKGNNTDYKLTGLTVIRESDPVYRYSASVAGNTVEVILTITNATTCEVEIKGLPAAINGITVTWELTESLMNYEPSIFGSQIAGFTITNTYNGEEPVEPVTIEITKTWSGEPEDHTRPSNEEFLNALILKGSGRNYRLERLTITSEAEPIYQYSAMVAGNEVAVTLTVMGDTTYTVVIDGLPGNLTWTLDENLAGYRKVVSGDQTQGFTIVNTYEDVPPTPPTPPFREFFRLKEMPKTGFSTRGITALPAKPLSVNYKMTNFILEIPSLSVSADIVDVPFMDDEYPVTWLDANVGMLEGSAKPGEGTCVITGHNHLSTMEAGPFAFIQYLEKGDKLFVVDKWGQMKSFTVYANEKIAETDIAGFEQIAAAYENSMTLITCEDERAEGGYASRRIIAAAPF